jgi:sarcosine oxidase subunit beta
VNVAVIGAGITGLAVACELAGRGAEVVVYERSAVGAGASGVQPGGVRQQWSTRVNCELARESVVFFRELSERLDADHAPTLEACGYLFLAHTLERLDQLAQDVALQNDAGVPSAILAADEVSALVPGLDATTVSGAAYCAEDGYFDRPQSVVEAFAAAAGRLGVRIELSTIAAVSPDGAGWNLERRADDAVNADLVVVACGYDSPALVAGLGTELPISKQARYLLLSEPIQERLLEPLVVSAELRFAAKHLANGRVLSSDLGAAGDPDASAAQWRTHVRETARQLLPILEFVTYPILVEGFYDVTPDHQPLVGTIPEHDGVWVVAGFSGHGFMLAPAIGRIVADAALDGRRDPALDAFAVDRFERGQVIPELQIV